MKRLVKSIYKYTMRINKAFAFVRICLLIITLQLSVQVNAKNYLINSSSELNAITPGLMPGDTIRLSSGNWTDEELLLEGKGTIDDNIVLTVESENETILTGASQLVICGEYLTVDGLRFENGYRNNDAVVEFRKNSSELAHNCRLTNTTISNYNPSDKDTDYKWVSIYGWRCRSK